MNSPSRAHSTLRVGILTVSDSAVAGTRQDTSGPKLSELVLAEGMQVVATGTVPDQREEISTWLRLWASETNILLTCGGTGLGPRDVTPEATREVIEQEEARRAEALAEAEPIPAEAKEILEEKPEELEELRLKLKRKGMSDDEIEIIIEQAKSLSKADLEALLDSLGIQL